MQRFFPDFESLDRFTLSLDCHPDTLQCPHCSSRAQLVSHGVVYKQRSIHQREAVGKRVLCSNRYQHAGCGRTIQFYVADVLPGLCYGTAHLWLFLSMLLRNRSVECAYQEATGRQEARHAWRWLRRLDHKLGDFRCCLSVRTDKASARFQARVRRLRLLLPTLTRLFSHFRPCPCAGYQLDQQIAFI